MGHKALVAERLFVIVKLQLILHQLQDLLHHPRHVHHFRHFAVELRRHQMQSDKPGFILGKLDAQPAGDDGPRLLTQFELLRIQPFNLPQQHVANRDAVFLPLDGKVTVVS